MSMGGGTTVTNSTPWAGAQPYLLDVMAQAKNLYGGGGGTGGGGFAGGGFPGITAASGTNYSGMGTSNWLGGLGSISPLGHLFGANNSSPIQDIARAQAQGLPISDAAWAKAGYGPGGASLNGGTTGGGTSGGTGTGTGGNYASQYPDLSPTTQTALGLISDRAMTGSPLLQTAQNTVQNFAGGGATNNPYLDQMFHRAADQVRDYTNAQFGAAGRGGSPGNQDYLGRNIGDLAAQMYGGAYETGQNRQLAAAQLAPNLANQDFVGLQQLLGAGQMYDTQALNKYNAPWDILGKYAGAVSGLGGLGGTQTSQAPSQSIFPSLLGAGLQALPYLL